MLPSKYFMRILKVARLCSAAVGADIADPNYHINWVTIIVICSIIGYFTFTISTILRVYEENWMFMLEATCMVGSVLQGSLVKIYESFEMKGTDYYALLNKNCQKVQKVITIVGGLYVFSFSPMCGLPFVMMAINGRRYLIMHFHVPGLDANTMLGYFVNLASHSLCTFAGAFGLFAGDLFVLIYSTQAYTFSNIFKVKVKKLNKYLAENHQNRWHPKTTKALYDILNWHQKYIKFTEECKTIFFVLVSVQVITSGLSIILTLFILVTAEWPGAYPYLLLTFLNLYTYCIMGTKIEICSAELTNDIYDISWYLMSVAQQKIVRMMLMKSQSPPVITVANVWPLSVSTALQATKTIYSIFMLMLQFVD